MWPTISNIHPSVAATINGYANNNFAASSLNAWIRVFSGADGGLIMQSNTDFKLFSAAGEDGNAIYGGAPNRSGVLGKNWTGGDVASGVGRALRPSPVITSFNSKEGKDQISRTCDFSITCFSLEQLELLQKYFMEPGYSIGVEWGWNTRNGASNLVRTGTGDPNVILNSIADATLNNGALKTKRISTSGEYDIFLGFIVGSTVSNEGENFKVDVKLRGAPSLPAYLQSQNRITVKPKDPKDISPDPDKSNGLYKDADLAAAGDTDEIVAGRRFKALFNALPAFRQTESVKSLLKSANKNDYINFDVVVAKQITTFQQQNEGAFLPGIFGDNVVEVKVGAETIEVSKEKLFSTNRYIRFGLAIDILNKMGEVDNYEIGNKKISFKINIDNTIIGAFPFMFSTKASKLIIPGFVPGFTSAYFLNPADVEQLDNGGLRVGGTDSQPATFDPTRPINFVNFVERDKDLNEFGLKEKKGYYGYLKNLYVNFDLFKEKIEQSNKTIKDILLDILNEMSSAVNSFWNFQIVEGELKKNAEQLKDELRAIAPFVAAPAATNSGTTTFNPLGGGFTAGVGFTNFNGSVLGGSGATGGGGFATNVGQFGGGYTPGAGLGGATGFGAARTTVGSTAVAGVNQNNTSTTSNWSTQRQSGGDIILTIIDENWIGENPDPTSLKIFKHSGVSSPFLNSTLDISIPADMANKIINDRLGNASQPDMQNLKTGTLFNSSTDLFLSRTGNSAVDGGDGTSGTSGEAGTTEEETTESDEYDTLLTKFDSAIDRTRTVTVPSGDGSVSYYYNSDGEQLKTVITGAGGVVTQVTYFGDNNPSINEEDAERLKQLESERIQAAIDAPSNKITSNIEKIDMVPMPTKSDLGVLTATDPKNNLLKNFFSFCFDDTDFFEKMKNHYFENKGAVSLSHPLPIKYSFTILGNSGIQRGDVFNIEGIPSKYRNSGLFHITEVEHSISGMRWETSITGEYRQIQ